MDLDNYGLDLTIWIFAHR